MTEDLEQGYSCPKDPNGVHWDLENKINWRCRACWATCKNGVWEPHNGTPLTRSKIAAVGGVDPEEMEEGMGC